MVERDSMRFDVVIVGAGPAGLACAIYLKDLVDKHNASADTPFEPEIVVLEKGKEVGAHIFSGAVMDPRGIEGLMPDWKQRGAPIESPVTVDAAYTFKETKARRLPLTPPPLKNHGNYVISLNRFIRWMGGLAEEKGISVFPGFPGRELVMQGDEVRGVQLQDAGVDKNGQPKGNFEPGANVLGRITVLAEGSRGSLTKGLVRKLGLEGRNPQVYATGVKEVWEVPKGNVEAGRVVHMLGWPHPKTIYGGGWIYGMGDGPDGGRLVSIGLVTGLDYADPSTDPHHYFQQWKLHPMLREVLADGKLLDYGAKTLPEGGLYAMPKNFGDGFLLIGDTGGFMNGMRLKGIHLAFRSGQLAAQAIFDALVERQGEEDGNGVLPASSLRRFQTAFENDWSYKELYRARNFHQGFEKGRSWGLLNAAFGTLFGGKGLWFRDGLENKASHEYMQKRPAKHVSERPKLPEDGTLTFDKVTDVYVSGTMHEEDQPCHLVVAEPAVCVTKCKEEYGNPCQYFCPANVYEMVAEEETAARRLQINASNCVHCKTCDIADPYQIINWVTPEGGGGPGYRLL